MPYINLIYNYICVHSIDLTLFFKRIFTVQKCAHPGGLSGVENATLPTVPALVNDTFTFTCKTGFTSRGESQLTSDVTVTCQANGRWDLGSLSCFGKPRLCKLIIFYIRTV